MTIQGTKGPTILIENPQSNQVNLRGLKLSHEGDPDKSPESPDQQAEQKQKADTPKSPEEKEKKVLEYLHLFNKLDFSEKSDPVILLKTGQLTLKECSIDLSLLASSPQSIALATILELNTTAHIEECHFIGSESFDTLGVVVKGANLVMHKTKIQRFKSGGMMIALGLQDKLNINISESFVENNSSFGIMAKGVNSEFPIIEDCQIENTLGYGLLIADKNRGALIRNTIKGHEENGILVINADPRIDNNLIAGNGDNGIQVEAAHSTPTEPQISYNKILGNKGNGVRVGGSMCKPVFKSNKIEDNEKAGIAVERGAEPIIVRNDIKGNRGEGIFLEEDCDAKVKSNNIGENGKANIPLDGKKVENTTSLPTNK